MFDYRVSYSSTNFAKAGITQSNFLHNVLASIVWKVVQVYDSLLQALVGNLISQPSENENQSLASLAEFLQAK